MGMGMGRYCCLVIRVGAIHRHGVVFVLLLFLLFNYVSICFIFATAKGQPSSGLYHEDVVCLEIRVKISRRDIDLAASVRGVFPTPASASMLAPA